MAEEEKTGTEGSKSGKSKSSMLMIIGLIIVGIVLAGAISFFVAAKIAGDRTVVTVVAKREPGVFLKIGDPREGVIVNIGGATNRYLKIVMTLEVEGTKGEKDKEPFVTPQDEIKIQDSVIKFLRSQPVDAFHPDKQEALKASIKTAVNESLGANRVLDVFITNFVIQ